MKNLILSLLVAVGLIGSASAQVLYAATTYSIGAYDANTGAVVNNSLVSLRNIQGLAVSGNTLFAEYIVPGGSTYVGKYDATTGAAINSSFISGLYGASVDGFTLSGNNLFVTQGNNVLQYDATTGGIIRSISTFPSCIGSSENNLFVCSGGTIQQYDASTGSLINNSFISGSQPFNGMAVTGNSMFLITGSPGYVSEYNATTGVLINSKLTASLYGSGSGIISASGNDLFFGGWNIGLNKYDATTGAEIINQFIPAAGGDPALQLNAITVSSTPEPSTYALFGIGAIGMLMVLRRRKKTA